jgi:hypothetical protein
MAREILKITERCDDLVNGLAGLENELDLIHVDLARFEKELPILRLERATPAVDLDYVRGLDVKLRTTVSQLGELESHLSRRMKAKFNKNGGEALEDGSLDKPRGEPSDELPRKTYKLRKFLPKRSPSPSEAGRGAGLNEEGDWQPQLRQNPRRKEETYPLITYRKDKKEKTSKGIFLVIVFIKKFIRKGSR